MAQSFSIDLSNFQSIGYASLEFEKGITLLVGQSNSGKSAVLRAIKAVLNNPSRAKAYIKNGHNTTNVTISTAQNNISWARSEKGSSYAINGEEYSKTGNQTLFDLLPRNGFVRDDEDNIMNIEGELDLPFPFDRTPSQLFKLFENIFCVSDSALIIKTFKDDETRDTKEKSTLTERSDRLRKKLSALRELAEEVNIEEVRAKLEELKTSYKQYEVMEKDIAALSRCELISQISCDEVSSPEEFSVAAYIELRRDLAFLINGVLARQEFYESLQPAIEVPKTLDEYEEIYKDLEVIETAQRLNTIEIGEEPPEIGESLDKYLELKKDIEYLELAQKIEGFEIAEPPEFGKTLEDYLTMYADYKEIVECFNMCKSKKERYAEMETKISSLQEQLDQYKVCPLCGHALNEEEEE